MSAPGGVVWCVLWLLSLLVRFISSVAPFCFARPSHGMGLTPTRSRAQAMPVYLRLSTWAEGVVGDKGINGCSAAGGVWCVVYKGVRRDTEQMSIRTRSMDADESRCAQCQGKGDRCKDAALCAMHTKLVLENQGSEWNMNQPSTSSPLPAREHTHTAKYTHGHTHTHTHTHTDKDMRLRKRGVTSPFHRTCPCALSCDPRDDPEDD